MRINLFFSFIFIIILSTSCTFRIIGVVSEYKRAWKEAPELMESIKDTPPLCTATFQKEQPLHIITAQKLGECLKSQPKAIVYQWATRCKGTACYLPDVLQAWCVDKGIELYVVPEHYDHRYIRKPSQLKNPMLIVDHKHYKTPWVEAYNRKFREELIGSKRRVKEWRRLLYFEYGVFKGFYHLLEDFPDKPVLLSN